MAEATSLYCRICNRLAAPYIAIDSHLLLGAQSQNWGLSILCKATRYTYLCLGTLATLAILFWFSFIIYPIQLALGIRLYRNPNYELKKWPIRILISLLALSLLEISLLGTQMWRAYRQGSVEILQLSPLKWWQYSKNVLVLGVLVAETLSPKFYTGYVDRWLERMKLGGTEKDCLKEAEKGLLGEKFMPEKQVDQTGAEIIGDKSPLDEAARALPAEDAFPEEEAEKAREHIYPKETRVGEEQQL